MKKLNFLFTLFFMGVATTMFGQGIFYSASQCLPTPAGTNLPISFTNMPGPSTAGTLTVYYLGDFNGATERGDIYDENAVLVGVTPQIGQCSANQDSAKYNITLGDLATWAADGTIDFDFTPRVAVNPTLCTPCGQIQFKLEYAPLTGPDDASVLSVDSPSVFCAGNESVLLTIRNAGTNQIDSVDVNWEVNGVSQPTFQYIGLLDTLGGTFPSTAQVNVGTYNFPAGSSTIRAWTSNPNGQIDTSTVNDTAVRTVITATPPPAATVSNITLTSAIGTIGNASGIDYVVVPFGSLPASGTPVSNVNSPFTMTGLTASTSYDLYVRKNCGAGNVSTWVGPTTFNTANGIPYLEDFETFNAGIFGNPWPRGWSSTTTTDPNWESEDANNGNNENSGGTGPLWDHTFFGGPTNGLYMYMETSGGTVGDSADFISPPILIDSTLSTVELGYWLFNHGANIDRMKVLVDTNGVENLLATYVGQQQAAQTDPWQFNSHFLNGYNGKSVRLIFRGFNVNCCSGDIAIDDISIDPVLPIDAGITDLLSPSGALCPGNIQPIVEVRNFGSTQLDSVKIYWNVNGALDSTTYVGTVAPGATFAATLGTVNIASGQIYNISFFTGDVNGQADQFAGNNTLTLAGLRTGLNGTVTVDPSQAASATNYIDFASLAATLSNYGVCGNATVNVANGTYNESLYLDNVPGLNATNTLTIDGGDSSLTILTHDGSTDFATLTLDGSDYVTVQNMTIQATANTGAAVLLTGGTDYNTITNSVLRMNPSTTSFNSAGLTISANAGSATATPSSDARYNTISNNKILGGYYGVRMYGNFNSINAVGNRVENNEIDSAYYYGAYMYYQDSAEVVGNDINMLQRGNTFADGIYMYANNNGKINENNVLADDYGIYWSNTNGIVTNELVRSNEIINNMVVSNTDYGMYIYAVDSVNFWYNSVQTFATSSPALYITTFGTYFVDDWDMRNNVLSADGGVALDMNAMTDTIFIKLDNNDYYAPNSANLVDINGTTYPDLASWQTAQPLLNTNSISGDPQFLSATDLHIVGAFLNDTGDASVPITVDIDGETRPRPGAAGVDVGADEFDPPTCPPATGVVAFNPSLDSITIAWDQAAGGYEYIIVNGGSPLSSGTGVLTSSDSLRIGGLTASTNYDLYVRIICGRGDTSLWVGPVTFNTANGVPYFQDFENWGLSTTGLINEEGWFTFGTPTPHWEISTRTTSSNTGPEEDHTIGTGGQFVHLETSGGSTGDTDTLWSAPIYFAPNQNLVKLKYWYHMYGAAMGTLEVYADTNGVLSPILSTFTGQQQPAQLDPWRADSALISGFADKTVQLVFVGVRGTSFTSDMAVDDVSLDVVAPKDVTPIALTEPLDDSLQCYTATEDVIVDLFNAGSAALDFTIDPVTIDVNVNGAITQTVTTTINTNTLNGGNPLASGTSISVTVGNVNMTSNGLYSFEAITSMTADGNSANDTTVRDITVLPYSAGAVAGLDSICGGDTTVLSTSGYYGSIQWQVLNGAVWTDISGATSESVSVSPSNTTDYRVVSCGVDSSNVFRVTPINFPAPAAIGDTVIVQCGDSGIAVGSATTPNTNTQFVWYDDPTSQTLVDTSLSAYRIGANGDSLFWTGTPGGIGTPVRDTVYVSEAVNAGSGSTLVITEVDPGSPDLIEVQNVSGRPIDVTGWSVAISDDYTNINTVNPIVQTLSGTWAPNQIQFWDDAGGTNDWGNNIFYNNSSNIWALIVDDLGNVVDFVVIGHSSANIQSMSVTIGGFTVSPGTEWTGPGIATGAPAGSSHYRQGNEDSNDLSDFIFSTVDGGVQNTGLVTPFAGGLCEGPRTPVYLQVNCITGVKELKSSNDYSLSPNPSTGLFRFRADDMKSGTYQLQIRSMSGKVVHTDQLNVNGKFTKDFDLSYLSKGVYFFRLEGEKESIIEKLIIQ